MNTILISGTAKNKSVTEGNLTTHLVVYSVYIWGSLTTQPLQLVTALDVTCNDYSELWRMAKDACVKYFGENHMQDGAYTQFLDHITIIW